MSSILEIAMTVFTGGTFATMLYLSFKVGHLQGCLTKVVAICEYLNHRTTTIEGQLGRLCQSGAVLMVNPQTGENPQPPPGVPQMGLDIPKEFKKDGRISILRRIGRALLRLIDSNK